MSSPNATDRSIKLLKTTDGRDKIYKLAAGVCKILAYNATVATDAKKFNTVAKSLGDARSLMRMAKWIQKGNEVGKDMKAISTGSKGAVRDYMKVFRVLGDVGYIAGDNLQWLCKYGLLPFDQKLTAARSKVCQFWGFFMSCVIGINDMLLHINKAGSLQDSAGHKLVLNFIKDFCDMLAALASVGYIESFKPSTGTVGCFGAISASIACHQNWKATA